MAPWPRAALVAACLLVGGCAQPGGGPGAPAAGTWEQLPPAPLSPRLQTFTAWTGTEALFIGGETGTPCPQGAACSTATEPARDGAAFDPATRSWRRIADAPLPIGPQPAAVVGDVVYLMAQGRLLSYDASADAWTTQQPPGGLDGAGLATDGSLVVAANGEWRAGDPPDQLYDPASRTWTPVPPDPLGPSFDRLYVGTPAGLVLTAKELVPNPGVEPAFVRAALLDSHTLTWTRLPDSEQIGGWHWTWTGRRLVDPSLGGADGGATDNYGRSYPFGGVLDPSTGAWGLLPDPPPPSSADGWPVDAVGGRLSATDGWVYDDTAETWTALPRPDGGPTVPGSAVWAGDRLVVLGGVDHDSSPDGALSGGAWLYVPSSGDDRPVPRAPDVVGDWELVDGTSGGVPLPRPRHGRGTLSVDAHQLSGTAFCNGFGGPYRLDGDRLVVGDVASTDMACVDPDRMAAEAAYLRVLTADGTRVTRIGDELFLENGAGLLRFRRQAPVPTSELVGTRWVLESLIDGETATSTVGEPAVLQLADDGTFTASTGCRPMTGTWSSSGDTVSLDYEWPDASCPPGVDAQEQHVIAVLGSGFQVAVEGDRLTVTERDGRALAYRAGG